MPPEGTPAPAASAAAVSGALWFSYLFALLYFAVAAGAVTHEDLFFERAVKLPFLNMELPLLAFFFLAPILFVVGHAYVLVHLVMLTDKAKRYDESLDNQIKEYGDLSKDELVRRAAIHAGLRQQLPSNIFVQFLAGPKELRKNWFGGLLRLIAWGTLVIAPILLLLMMQIQFLPFHSSPITRTQRVALAIDLFFVWWLWSRILSGREVDAAPRRSANWMRPAVGALSIGILLFSWGVATFPGEWQGNLPNQEVFWLPFLKPDRELVTLNRLVFQSDVDQTTRRRWLPFSNTLVLPGLNIYEGLRIDDPEKARWHDFVFRARGRDLRGAILDFAILPKVDFEGAELGGASLKEAQLQGASLVRAQLKNASLAGAQLQGASLERANLQGASLFNARLEGASLHGAQLQGAERDDAQLQGALLSGADLQGASLGAVQLQGALLKGTGLQGASLHHAHLEAAWLYYAHLEAASLDYARLNGASLSQAYAQGASFANSTMEAADLSHSYLWRTNRPTPPSKLAAIRMSGGEVWLPEWWSGENRPWDDKAYRNLRTAIESLPPGGNRDKALRHIQNLDCSSFDKTLAACDPSAAPPPHATAWRNELEAAGVDERTYAEALANALRGLVCSGGADAIYVVRGEGFQERLHDAGRAASELIDDLTNKDSKDCPVTAALTDADRAKLLEINQKIEAARGPQKSATSDAPHSP